MNIHTESDKKYFMVLHYDNLASLETYLESSGLEYNKTTVQLYSKNKKQAEHFELIGNIKQLYKFISDLIPNKYVRLTTNENGTIKDITIKGFNKKETVSLLKITQDIYINDKKT